MLQASRLYSRATCRGGLHADVKEFKGIVERVLPAEDAAVMISNAWDDCKRVLVKAVWGSD